jgi:leader peptidase (prepilin peptidase)/N-methyltransferase
MPWSEQLVYAVMIILMIASTITDLKERLIYDRFILIGVLFSIIFRIFYRTEPWWEYLVTGVGALFILATVAAITGGTAIGGGDIKAFAMIGLALGFIQFLYIFLISHVLAAVFMFLVKLYKWKEVKRDTEFPFAPFILLGLIITNSFTLFGFI